MTNPSILSLDLMKLNAVYRVGVRTQKQSLSYALKIQPNLHTPTLRLLVKNVTINDLPSDLLVEQLAYKCGQVLYPLELSLTPTGTIGKIVNYSTLKQNWSSLKSKLLQYYTDSYSLTYIQNQNNVYSSAETLLNKIKDTPFFASYFFGIYNLYLGEDLTKEYTKKIKGVDYQFYQHTEVEPDSKKPFNLIIEGENTDRQEKIYLRIWLHLENKNIEKIVYLFFRNEEVALEMNIESQSQQKELKPIIALPKEKPTGLPKTSKEFWVDEINYN